MNLFSLGWRRLFRSSRENKVSQAWISQRARSESRIEFHGVGWRWPLNKAVNEAANYNRFKLRKRA